MNVLLLSGYWPVVGTSLAVFTSEGKTAVIVPSDERVMADNGWADELRILEGGSLQKLKSPLLAAMKPLAEIASATPKARIGFESDAVSEPSSYASMNLYGSTIEALVAGAFQAMHARPCRRCSDAPSFEPNAERDRESEDRLCHRRRSLRGREGKAAAKACGKHRRPRRSGPGWRILVINTVRWRGADGFAFCMSGENSYEASATYQRSRSRQLKVGDLALVHCNSYADGLWTDIHADLLPGRAGRKDAGNVRRGLRSFACRICRNPSGRESTSDRCGRARC